jgi:hypothetical protein
MTRHALLQFAAVFFLAMVSFAQENSQPAPTPIWSGTYSANLKTRYFGSTVCATFANQGVAQQELDITRSLSGGRTSITATIWNSTGFTRAFTTFAYETDIDLNVGHRFGKYDVGVGGWLFLLNPKAGFAVSVIDARVSRTFSNGTNTVTPFVEVQRYGLTNRVANHGGIYPMIGATYSGKLNGRFAVVAQYHANYDANGGFGYKGGKLLFYTDLGLRIALGESLSVIFPRFGYGGSYNDPARPVRFIWSAGIAKTF